MLKLPEYLHNRTTTLKNLTSGLGASLPAHVSLDGDRFTLIDENGLASRNVPPSLTLDFVVVGSAELASRVYYDGPFDRATATAPTCYSNDALVPADDAPQKQSETCGQCPQAVWGSKVSPNGNKIPACSTRKKIAVIVPAAGAKIYLLSIPPASLKAWRNFVDYVVTNGASPQYIITRAIMEDKELKFDAVDFVPKEVADAVDAMIEKQAVEIARVVGDTPQAIALPPPKAPEWMKMPKDILDVAEKLPAIESNKPQRGRPRKETIIPPGPIQKDAFAGLKSAPMDTTELRYNQAAGAVEDEEVAMLRRLEEIRAAKAGNKAVESAMTAQQAEKFIGGGTPFGISSSPPPPPNEVADMLAKAFKLT